ncbi:MAG TPA: disulfide bond formation protein B [Candidatus Paceibacterota bacterium]|nr:disulfide bond formation protein B [Candidatus Paceibacterota bacterium]
MSPAAETLSFILALGAVLLELGTLGIIALAIIERGGAGKTRAGDAIAALAMPAAFVLALVSSAVTLVYSEHFGIVPCGLCWLQRAFLYPQAFIAGAALVLKDRRMAPWYLIVLSIPGALIALYQYYLQMGGSELISCPASAGDCARRYIFELGYVTFPMLALSVFAFIIALVAFARLRPASHAA